jgi:hypothetical protein
MTADFEMTVDLSGLRRVKAQEPGRVDAWLRGVSIQIVGDVKLSFGTGPGGRSYKRGGKWHVASVAGKPPNSDTGNLIGTIRQEKQSNLKYHVMDGTTYGGILELQKDRAFIRPAFDLWGNGKLESDAKQNLDLE